MIIPPGPPSMRCYLSTELAEGGSYAVFRAQQCTVRPCTAPTCRCSTLRGW